MVTIENRIINLLKSLINIFDHIINFILNTIKICINFVKELLLEFSPLLNIKFMSKFLFHLIIYSKLTLLLATVFPIPVSIIILSTEYLEMWNQLITYIKMLIYEFIDRIENIDQMKKANESLKG